MTETIYIQLRKDGIDRFNTGLLPEYRGYMAQVDARGDGWDSPKGSKWKAWCNHYGERREFLTTVAEVPRQFQTPEAALAELNRRLERVGVQVVRCIPFYPARCSEIGCDVPSFRSVGPKTARRIARLQRLRGRTRA